MFSIDFSFSLPCPLFETHINVYNDQIKNVSTIKCYRFGNRWVINPAIIALFSGKHDNKLCLVSQITVLNCALVIEFK